MTTPSQLRKQILKQRGVEMKKHTRKPVAVIDRPVPFTKTNLMRLLELQHAKPIEELIFNGTIYAVEKKLGVDASTISKWRKIITEARGKEFFNKFE